MKRPDWQHHGSCRDNWELFDPTYPHTPEYRAGPDRRRRHAAALRICAECPVLAECRDWAVHNYADSTGVVGGFAGHELAHYRHRHGIPRPKQWTPTAEDLGLSSNGAKAAKERRRQRRAEQDAA